ncbi:94b67994-572d-4acf-96fc-7b92493a263d-CDS [Sclerotinia trifoliorum]|uniref:94b67994-572d-4acf-96fc-7b92493a263d-CDS n=1 Tax=Sclerotinia trifoliorum TaxID=28548 RepID=A0A8H2VMN0_9HELO|nr:94b67994-572d-4acf-96fc-7b92493a263d-CDS [Sclerotinia trifoliorum]
MSFRPSGLITNPFSYGAYLQASKPELRKSATILFWEDILNDEFEHYKGIRVNSQQSLDNTTRSADVVVRSYDREFNPVLLLILECKHQSRTHREIDEMELQFELYVQDYFSEFGKSQG